MYSCKITESLFSSPGYFIRKTYIFRLSGPQGDCDLSTLTRLGTYFTYVSRTSLPAAFSHTETYPERARASLYVSASFVSLDK